MTIDSSSSSITQTSHAALAAQAFGSSDLSVSVADCLKIPPLDQATVIAGRAGLIRRINWVHVVDHSDMEDSLGTNELLLTSGIALAGDEALQREIFAIMDRKNSAGLVVALGQYMTDIPAEMRQMADIFEIPILTIPWEVNFGDITRVLLTQFVQSHYQVMELSQRLNQELLDIVLRKGDLIAVCACIGRLMGASVMIFDEALKLVAATDTASGGAGSFNETRLRRALSTRMFDRVAQSVAQILTLDGQAEGIAAPISVSGRRRGFIVIQAAHPFVATTARLGEIAATVAALVIAHEDELFRVARHTDGRLIGILNGTVPARAGMLAEIGLKANEPAAVLVADFETEDMPVVLQVAQAFLRGRTAASALAVRGRSVVGLVQKPKDRQSEWAHKLERHLGEQGFPCQIGITGPIVDPVDISARHDDVMELLRLRHFLQPSENVINTEHSTISLRTLRILAASGDVGQLCPAIVKIRERDRSLHGSLIEALSCLLEVEGNISLAARRLGIHRHTILYRLNRISEILGTELNASVRFELRLQLLAWNFAGPADRADGGTAKSELRK